MTGVGNFAEAVEQSFLRSAPSVTLVMTATTSFVVVVELKSEKYASFRYEDFTDVR